MELPQSEKLLHYCWKHRLLPLRPLATVDGLPLEVIHPGTHNNDAGPDFFNAKVKIGGQLWVGNVEIHLRASDWFRHHHDTDPAYRNVVLHVVALDDCRIPIPEPIRLAEAAETGQPAREFIPQFVLEIPAHVRQNYLRLSEAELQPRCANIVPTLPKLLIHSWMSALTVERLEDRTRQVELRRQACEGDWERTCFVTLARNFGFGLNSDAMEQWAMNIPLSAVGKHRDQLFQVEAIFLGQAGLLASPAPTASAQKTLDSRMKKDPDVAAKIAHSIGKFREYQAEYQYLRHKFSLTPIDPTIWRFLRMRPQNFPYTRIVQLANLYHEQRFNFSRAISAETLDDCRQLLDTHVSDFWQTHYTFTTPDTAPAERKLSAASKNLLILNAIVPLVFAYGRYKNSDELCDRALTWLEQLPPESNSVIAHWQQCGIDCESAADTQALIQLSRRYCDESNCLRCRFGYEFIRNTPDLLCDGSAEGAAPETN